MELIFEAEKDEGGGLQAAGNRSSRALTGMFLGIAVHAWYGLVYIICT